MGQKEKPSRTKINYKIDTQFLLVWAVFSFSTLKKKKKREYIVESTAFIPTTKIQMNYFPLELGKKSFQVLVQRKLCRVLWSSPIEEAVRGSVFTSDSPD